MRVLRARIYEAERERQAAEQAAARSAQVGTGARAEKIRTYNFPENRVTDHRIKLTTHRLEQVLAGRPRRVTPTRSPPPSSAARSKVDTRAKCSKARADYLAARGSREPAPSTPSCCSRARSACRASSSTRSTTGRSPRPSARAARELVAATRPARAARLRARRLGLPPADAEDRRARARPAAGDGDRRRALPRAARRDRRAARRRRRHRQRRDRARARARAARRARARDRHLARRARARARERDGHGLDGRVRTQATCSQASTGRSTSSSRTRRTSRRPSSTRSSPRCATGSRARALVADGQTERARARGAARCSTAGSCSRCTRRARGEVARTLA